MADTLDCASLVLTNTNATDVLVVPNVSGNERVLVVGLNVCNVGANSANITLSRVTAAGATLSRYAHQEVVDANSRKELLNGNGKLVLKAGERLRATASLANALEVTASLVISR
jgi:hypothetical protein